MFFFFDVILDNSNVWIKLNYNIDSRYGRLALFLTQRYEFKTRIIKQNTTTINSVIYNRRYYCMLWQFDKLDGIILQHKSKKNSKKTKKLGLQLIHVTNPCVPCRYIRFVQVLGLLKCSCFRFYSTSCSWSSISSMLGRVSGSPQHRSKSWQSESGSLTSYLIALANTTGGPFLRLIRYTSTSFNPAYGNFPVNNWVLCDHESRVLFLEESSGVTYL